MFDSIGLWQKLKFTCIQYLYDPYLFKVLGKIVLILWDSLNKFAINCTIQGVFGHLAKLILMIA